MKRDAFSAEDTAQEGWSRTLLVPRATPRHLLAAGTRVGEVEIAGVIGEGSAGIVYLAFDPSLERRVAVKEYLPSALAARRGDGSVVVRSDALAPAFRAGLDGFVAEARLLARFDHPSLVKVYRVWEANGTAYLVMPYYEGPTLARKLSEAGAPLDEPQLRKLLAPLLDALEMIHAGGHLHLDISADNILLTAGGPVLLDFGVVRRAIGSLDSAARGGLTHAPTVVLQRGYAPIEQYGESDSLRPGPWTDLYALGCVLHLAITGQAPGSALDRLCDDWQEPLATSAAGRYAPGLLAAVDAMLAVQPVGRPQDVASLRRLLDDDGPAASPTAVAATMTQPGPGEMHPPAQDALEPWAATMLAQAPPMSETSGRGVRLALVSIGLVIGIGLSVRWLTESVERDDVRGAAARAVPVPVAPAAPVASAAPSTVTPPVPIQADTALPSPTPEVVRRPVGGTVRSAVTVAAPKAPPVALPDTSGRPPLATTSAEPATTVGSSARWPARCFDILQKASLERVSDEETAFLRDACR